MTREKLRAKLRNEKAQCEKYCGTYSKEEKDCKIYGCRHPRPANCPYYIARQLNFALPF